MDGHGSGARLKAQDPFPSMPRERTGHHQTNNTMEITAAYIFVTKTIITYISIGSHQVII